MPLVFVQTVPLGHAFLAFHAAADRIVLPLMAWTSLLSVLAPNTVRWNSLMKDLDRHISTSKRGGPCYNVNLQKTVVLYGRETEAVALQLIFQIAPDFALYLKISKRVFATNDATPKKKRSCSDVTLVSTENLVNRQTGWRCRGCPES